MERPCVKELRVVYTASNGLLQVSDLSMGRHVQFCLLSLQENAAYGVTGRRAVSSASPIIVVLLSFVLLFIIVRYCCLPLVNDCLLRQEKVLN